MRISLIAKLTISTSLILLIFMVFFAYINIETLKTMLLEAAISDADKLSETIIKSTHYEMLEDNRKRAYQMIQEVGTLQGVKYIRMINKSGNITFSTDKDEIGRYLDKTEAGCNMCHTSDEPKVQASTMNRSRIFYDKTGKTGCGHGQGHLQRRKLLCVIMPLPSRPSRGYWESWTSSFPWKTCTR